VGVGVAAGDGCSATSGVDVGVDVGDCCTTTAGVDVAVDCEAEVVQFGTVQVATSWLPREEGS